ncbi:MAG: CHAT domain-containing protein [Anaerolineales bacterium]
MSNQPRTPPKHFVVFVPGYMGSQLRSRSTGEIVWIDLPAMLRNPLQLPQAVDEMFGQMEYPNPDLEPAGILEQVVFAPPLFKQEQYGRMLDALRNMGYHIDPQDPVDPAAYTFAYDWRQDNRISARQLGEKILSLQDRHPGAKAWLIGHSNGGIVSRWYIEKEGGKDHVGRLFLMGSPWDGAPKAIQVMQDGLNVLFMRLFNLLGIPSRTRDLIRSFPSFYQLIPYTNPFLRTPDNQALDVYGDPSWLETDAQRAMLADARQFNQDLGTTLSVETLCFFGYRKETTTGGIVTRDAGGLWTRIDWDRTEAGDGTVPERSAVHPQAKEKLPFQVGHGDIYVNTDVLEKLEWELVRKYRAGVLAEATTSKFRIMFEPMGDVFEPGETIPLWATVKQVETGAPEFEAEIDVRLVLRMALSLEQSGPLEVPDVSVRLAPSETTPGRYEGELTAPELEGYYRLAATVRAAGEIVPLEELVLVERPPDHGLLGFTGAEPPEPDEQPLEELGPAGPTGFVPPPIEPSGGRSGFDPLEGLGPDFSVGVPPIGAVPDTAPGAGAQPEKPPRYLQALLPGQDKDRPLQTGRVYPLSIGIDLEKLAGGGSVEFDDQGVFEAGEEWVALLVNLDTQDFKVQNPEPQQLLVPRLGASWNRVVFMIEPLHAGEGELTVMLLKNNNYVQSMVIHLNVDNDRPAMGEVQAIGRSMEKSGELKPRDLHLNIKFVGNAYNLNLFETGANVKRATLLISPEFLDNLIQKTRQALLDIVYLYQIDEKFFVYQPKAGKEIPASITLPYQQGIKIPDAIHQEALQRLAEAGWFLFYKFFLDTDDNELLAIGERLLALGTQQQHSLQISSRDFLLPWALLYLAEEAPAAPDEVDTGRFLGYRHLIEHIPFDQNPKVGYEIPSENPTLSVGLNLNTGIDAEMGIQVVAQAQAFWQALADQHVVQVSERLDDQSLIEALKNPELPDQIMYFYCHADSQGLDEKGGPGESSLQLSGNTRVTLDNLEIRAPTRRKLEQAPLVFINACESAELSPLFYAGFMPYFTKKGARGVIGTECRVPALFAAEFAQRFFKAFLSGEKTLAEVMFALRRDFLEQESNVLGLLYASYCDGDLRINPGLSL